MNEFYLIGITRIQNLASYLRVALASAARNMNLDSSLSIRASRPPYSCSCIASAILPLLEPSPGATDLSKGLRGLQTKNLESQNLKLEPSMFEFVKHPPFTMQNFHTSQYTRVGLHFAKPQT